MNFGPLSNRINSSASFLFALVLLFFLMGDAFCLQAQEVDSLKRTLSDSATLRMRQKLSAKDSVEASVRAKQDSIRKVTSTASEKINNIRDKYTSRADSLKGKGNPSFNLNLDTLKPGTPKMLSDVQNKSSDFQHRVNGKSDSLQQKADQALQKINDKIQQKIDGSGIDKSALSEAGLGDVKVPGVNTDVANLPDANLPDMKLPGGSTTDLPKVDVPSVNTDLPSTPDANVPATGVNNPVESSGSLKLPDVNGKLPTDEISEVGEKIQSVSENASEVQEHVEELKEIKDAGLEDPDKLAGQAEDKISEVSQVQSAQKSLSAVEEKQRSYEAMVAKYKDKKMVMSEMKRKMANIATEQINQSTPGIKEAQEVMAKEKHVLAKTGKVKGAVKKKNVLDEKPFGQRVIPGLTFQTMRGEDFVVDFGLQTGYRLTERLCTGVGVTYTVGFNKSYDLYTRGLNTFGTRAYGDFMLMNKFFVHGEFVWGQYRNFQVSSPTETPAEIRSGVNTGLGKQFNLSKRLRGNMMVLYRVSFQGKIPQQSRINVRFGFDLYPKRKKKIQN